MNNNQVIFDLNYHYLWLVKKMIKINFNKASAQFGLEPDMLKIIDALSVEELSLLSLEEKTIFSWKVNCDDLDKMFIKSLFLPENKLKIPKRRSKQDA